MAGTGLGGEEVSDTAPTVGDDAAAAVTAAVVIVVDTFTVVAAAACVSMRSMTSYNPTNCFTQENTCESMKLPTINSRA